VTTDQERDKILYLQAGAIDVTADFLAEDTPYARAARQNCSPRLTSAVSRAHSAAAAVKQVAAWSEGGQEWVLPVGDDTGDRSPLAALCEAVAEVYRIRDCPSYTARCTKVQEGHRRGWGS
jgi:hypothetical protein